MNFFKEEGQKANSVIYRSLYEKSIKRLIEYKGRLGT